MGLALASLRESRKLARDAGQIVDVAARIDRYTRATGARMAQLDDYRRLSDAYAVGTYKRVLFTSVRKKVTVQDLQLLSRYGAEHTARCKDRVCSLSMSDVTIPMPDQETRKIAARMMTETAATSVGYALVLEGEGFLAGTARAVGAAIGMLARGASPWKTFANVDDGAVWVTGLLGYPSAEARILAGLAKELRNRHLAEP